MITIFTYPKPWLPEFASIQTSAIQSWKELGNRIVLLGNDDGTLEAAQRLSVDHVANGITQNQWGTPEVDSIFNVIRRECKTPIACFVNTDIVLGKDFINTIETVSSNATDDKWLMVGRRTDLAISDVEIPTQEFITLAHETGTDHGADGIDYFVFPPTTFEFVFPFALGKFTWDQWLVGNVYRRGLMSIDCSNTIFAVHLNADWYFNGKPENNGQRIYDSDEGLHNRSFDYYQRTIASGTNFMTVVNDNAIEIIEKPHLDPNIVGSYSRNEYIN